ncbi:MAG: efflux RND transporter periplasmic adaptor subunit [Planctomycetales bacterium]|nr:efflux RND transporter periplasmic adaptor subunit [Planctomycetales bacterium]
MSDTFRRGGRFALRHLLKWLTTSERIARKLRWWFAHLAVATATFAALAYIVWLVILPAYQNPKSRLYTSKLGYAKLLRSSGKPFPVKVANVQQRHFAEPILGEGIIASQPVTVPVIPMDFITKVHVTTGDIVHAGQLLAELDDSRAKIKVESARLAVSTTEAESRRVEIGSAYVLAQERPEKDQINLEAAQKRAEKIKEQQQMYETMFTKGIISKSKFLELEKELIEEEKDARLAKFYLGMSEKGVKQSLRIAKNAVEDARRALAHRQAELAHYQVRSPCDGVVERVLIADGEYNQDAGKPAFLIARGMWFECHLDQRVINRIETGQSAKVYLEAMPGQPLTGKITKVIPLVSFNLGGPETNRPLRPRGSGGPEWPATFRVNIEFDELPPNQQESDNAARRLVPGMTGFGEVLARRESMAVPLSSVSSLSAGSGFVYVMIDDANWTVKGVRTGAVKDGFIEILSGLQGNETVISQGHEVLEEGDLVKIQGRYDGPRATSDSYGDEVL